MVSKQLELFAPAPRVSRPRVGLTVASLQSGSSGNATLIAAGNTTLVIDCGISPSHLAKRLEQHGRSLEQVSAVFITHEHSDHAGGAGVLARRHKIPLYMTAGTAAEASRRILKRDVERAAVRLLPDCGTLAFRDGASVDPGEGHNLKVEWVPVPHDAREPVAYVVERQGVRASVLTDVGHASKDVCRVFETLDVALLETNHDRGRLRDGPYPASLKRRISSSLGHLSNAEAARLVRDHGAPRLRALLLGHLSAVNNAPALAEQAMRSMLERRRDLEVQLHLTFRDRASRAVEV